MARGRELLKNTGILMLAKISTQIVNFLLLPLYTHILATEEYGIMDIYTSLAMIITPLVTLQIEMALFRFFIVCNNKSEEEQIISSSFAIVAIMLAVASVAYFVLSAFFSFSDTLLLYYFYFTQIITTVLLQCSRARGDTIGYSVGSFLASTVVIIFNVILLCVFNLKLRGMILSTIIAQSITCFFLIFRTKIYCWFKFSRISIYKCKKLLSYSIPLVFNQIGSWVINYSNRLVILSFWGSGINGIYSVANKFPNVINTFFGVFNVAWTENVIKSIYEKDTNYIAKMFTVISNVYCILITGVLNFLPFVWALLVDSSYSDAYDQVPILLLSTYFSGMAATLGSIYIAEGKTKEVSITTILTGIINIVIHLLFINRLKLFAAPISTLIAFLILFLFRLFKIKKVIPFQINFKEMFIKLIILIACSVIFEMKNYFLIGCGLVINVIQVIVLCINNKKEISMMISKQN